LVVTGLDANDPFAGIHSVINGPEGYKAWCRMGEKQEAFGEPALLSGSEISAGETFARAADGMKRKIFK
jgi:hypothetical protein